MEIILDIKDNKVDFFLELLKNFTFVKTKSITPYKSKIYEDLADSVHQMNLVKEGKVKTRSAQDLLNEL